MYIYVYLWALLFTIYYNQKSFYSIEVENKYFLVSLKKYTGHTPEYTVSCDYKDSYFSQCHEKKKRFSISYEGF